MNRPRARYQLKSGKPFYRCEVGEAEATVYLYDAIDDWFGLSAKDVIDEMNALDAKTINLRINSPGGDVFDARAIATTIQQLNAKTVAHIDGVAASAATYIALACDEVVIAEGAMMMIHKAWTIAMGNDEDFIQMAELLLKIDDTIVQDYHKKTGIDRAELMQMMSKETWMSASEAVEMGFADSVYSGENEQPVAVWDTSKLEVVQEKCEDVNNIVDDTPENCYDRARFERRLALAELEI